MARNKAPTIRDVARLAGVSVATVSRHLNGSSRILPGTSLRVIAAMAQLHFEPSLSARNLANNRTGTFGLLLSNITGDFFTPLLEGIEDCSALAGYTVLTASTTHWSADSDTPPPLGPRNCDGLIVVEGTLPVALLRRWSSEGFPLVVVYGAAPSGSEIPSVVLDNESGIAALVSHLHREHGRTRFLHLAGPEASTDAAERRAAFVAAVYRLPGCSGQSVAGDFDRETARHSVECLLAANPVGRPSFDAIVAADDESAVGALQALRSAGLRVPEDVSLTGFDDQSYAAMIHPALSTVRSPSGDLGRSAVELLLAQVAHRAAAPTTRIATSLVFRESCGCSAIAPPSGAILP